VKEPEPLRVAVGSALSRAAPRLEKSAFSATKAEAVTAAVAFSSS
jgi:hypothetical protein